MGKWALPLSFWVEVPKWANCYSSTSGQAAAINDDGDLAPAEKEQALIALFAENGLKLSFTGLYNLDMLRRSKKEVI